MGHKLAFIRKVYSILFVQIVSIVRSQEADQRSHSTRQIQLGTCLVSGILSQSPSAISWVQSQ